MQAKTHPLEKTATDLRRSIIRLQSFKEAFPDAPEVAKVDEIINDLREARSHIPGEYRDNDLER